jgi:L-threonylcarbamoyladenylate synthase
MILYPTETLYALGVNVIDPVALAELYLLKERDASSPASWLVRSMEDVETYAEVGSTAAKIAHAFLPGKLTLVLKALPHIPFELIAPDKTIGFRISSDPVAQRVITEFMEEHNAPLTCTSANVSGLSTLGTVGEILQQFGENANLIKKVVDDGPRKGLASTIVRVIADEVTVLREGDITESDIKAVL